eukprot:7568408-Pyramimonas_sp.AAC.2
MRAYLNLNRAPFPPKLAGQQAPRGAARAPAARVRRHGGGTVHGAAHAGATAGAYARHPPTLLTPSQPSYTTLYARLKGRSSHRPERSVWILSSPPATKAATPTSWHALADTVLLRALRCIPPTSAAAAAAVAKLYRQWCGSGILV